MYTFYIRQDVKHLLTKDPHEIKSILCYLKAHYHFISIERSPPNYSFKRKCFGPRQKTCNWKASPKFRGPLFKLTADCHHYMPNGFVPWLPSYPSLSSAAHQKRNCDDLKYPPSSSIVVWPLPQFMAPSFPLLRSGIKLESLVVYPQVSP